MLSRTAARVNGKSRAGSARTGRRGWSPFAPTTATTPTAPTGRRRRCCPGICTRSTGAWATRPLLAAARTGGRWSQGPITSTGMAIGGVGRIVQQGRVIEVRVVAEVLRVG